MVDANLNFFVYGTLKPGEVNHWVCASYITAIQPAIVAGRLYHLPLGYPAITTVEEGIVHGYLCSFDDPQVVSILDEFEQHDPQALERVAPGQSLDAYQYSREVLALFTPKRSPLGSAWGYVMTCEQIRCLRGNLVPEGNWHSNYKPSDDL